MWWLFLLSGGAGAVSAPGYRDLNSIRYEKIKKKISRSDRTVETTCDVFERFVAIETLREGEKFPERVVLRPISGAKQALEACDADAWKPETVLDKNAPWVWGAQGPYLFMRNEAVGDTGGLSVWDWKTGKLVHEDTYSEKKSVLVRAQGDRVSLRYYRRLEGTYRSDDKKASNDWKNLLAQNSVPKSVALQVPDCSEVIKARKAFPDADLTEAFFVPVEVEVARPSKRTYLSGKAHCTIDR